MSSAGPSGFQIAFHVRVWWHVLINDVWNKPDTQVLTSQFKSSQKRSKWKYLIKNINYSLNPESAIMCSLPQDCMLFWKRNKKVCQTFFKIFFLFFFSKFFYGSEDVYKLITIFSFFLKICSRYLAKLFLLSWQALCR